MDKKFYITTTLPYVNAKPHIGFALEIVQADVIARYQTLLGKDVFFNFGTDEHGQKIYSKALEEGKDPQVYADEYAAKFGALKEGLNLSYNNFIRTTDSHHISAAQEMWNRCLKAGYIEKGIYKAKYCVGCELEKQDSELVDGKCSIHPNRKIESIEEENYFFKFSKFQQKLLDLYDKYPDFVLPKHRLTEIKKFVEGGLEDFSVSRLKEKMPWGIPVPDDDKHILYVWFDALTNYISALGWPEDETKFKDYWGTKENQIALQVAGKDNLRQQASMWQAMLMAADLPPTRQIFIHGFITSGGQKMSKSLGNVIDPFEYIEKFGTDALRYYLLSKINPGEDSDFTKEKFDEVYNADLANGLGNLIARVAKLCENAGVKGQPVPNNDFSLVENDVASFRFDFAMDKIWQKVKSLDKVINADEPWLINDKDSLNTKLVKYCNSILEIANLLVPFLPQTAERILKQFSSNLIKSQEPLFPRAK